MNCFTGTSMMISDQLKAVCCRRECVERNWILFGYEGLTALRIRQDLGTFAQSEKASITFIMSVGLSVSLSVCLSICPQVSARFTLDEFMLNLFEGFHENVLRKSKLIKIEQKIAIYMKIGVCFIVAGNINPYPTAFPYGNVMVLHFYQQQQNSTTKTVHKVINKGLKTYV